MTTPFYGTFAGYVAYWAERGTTVLSLQPAVEAGLLVASEYLDGNYRRMFPGQKTGLRAQAREWPRNGAYDYIMQTIQSDEIPDEMIRATYETASRQLATPGSLRTDSTLGTSIQSVAVSGAVSVVYAGAARVEDLQLSIPVVDAILAPILLGGTSLSQISGAAMRGR